VSQVSASYVIIHGAFARPSGTELMEVAALQAGQSRGDGFCTQVRCDVPDRPQELAADGHSAAMSEEENRNAPSAGEVFTYLNNAFALGQATAVMWGGMAYRCDVYAKERQLTVPFFQTRVIDLQAAVVSYFDLKTSQCKSPRSAVQWLNLAPEADNWSSGSLPSAYAMNVVLGALIAAGWTPESTPDAITNGCEIGKVAEEMRMDRWEQIRERQTNLGIKRRPLTDMPRAFIVLDCEHVSIRRERFARLIEVALVVAYPEERQGRVTYDLAGEPFSSLVQLEQVDDAWSKSWEMTGIDPTAVRLAPPLPQVIAAMVAAAPWDRGVLVTWGPDDAPVITQNCVRTGIRSPITDLPLIDLQRAFSHYYDLGSQQIGLQNAASILDIDTSGLGLHRALADTLVTWQILDRMLTDGWTPHWRTWHRVTATAPTAK
jgi:inhibitor of KinA sporulation pathway (predicted exonuclease)